MLERHDCDYASEAENGHEDERETPQDETETFSPRDYQQGFWS
jgi:hypothetical protein